MLQKPAKSLFKDSERYFCVSGSLDHVQNQALIEVTEHVQLDSNLFCTLHRRFIPQNFRLSKIRSKITYKKGTKLGDILCISFFGKGVSPILRNKRILKL